MSTARQEKLPTGALLCLLLIVSATPLWLGGVPTETTGLALVLAAIFCGYQVHGGAPLVFRGAPWPLRLLLLVAGLGLGLGLVSLIPFGLPVVSQFLPGDPQWLGASRITAQLEPWTRQSVDPELTRAELLRGLSMVILFTLAGRIRWPGAAALVALSACLVALVGLGHEAFALDRIYGSYRPLEIPADAPFLARGPFVNANHQSGLLLLGLLAAAALALHLWLRARDPRASAFAAGEALTVPGDGLVLALSACALLLLDIWLLGSRMALAVCIVLIPLGLVLGWRALQQLRLAQGWPQRQRSAALLAMVCGGLALAWLAGLFGGEALLASLPNGAEYATVERKIGELQQASQLVHEAPWLGLGRGCFGSWSPLVMPGTHGVRVHHVESWPLLLAVEFGLPFAVLAGVSLCWWWVWVWRATEAAPRLLLLGVTAVLLQNLADFNLEYGGVGYPLAIVMGSLSGEAIGIPKQNPNRRRPAARRWWLALAAVSLLAAASHLEMANLDQAARRQRTQLSDAEAQYVLGRRALDANAWYQLSRNHLRAGRPTEAERLSQLAVGLDPGATDPHLLRATILRAQGDQPRSHHHLRLALERSPWPIPAELAAWLVREFSAPQLAAALAGSNQYAAPLSPPLSGPRLLELARTLAPRSADHARELLRLGRTNRLLANDAMVSDLQSQLAGLAFARGRRELARHHMQLALTHAPDNSHLLLQYIEYTIADTSEPGEAAEDALERALDALDNGRLDDPTAVELAVLRAFLQRPRPGFRPRIATHMRRLAARRLPSQTARIRDELLRSFENDVSNMPSDPPQ